MKNKICGVVVIYNPEEEFTSIIDTYVDDIGHLIVVDNSSTFSGISKDQLRSDITFICPGVNIGVSRALNIAAEMAISNGFEFLLTMDQDSRANPGMVQTLLACHNQRVGLASPCLLTCSGQRPPKAKTCRPVQTAMTSGSLLNLGIYRDVGPFRDDFFIDFVDVEFCLRLQKYGYRILQANSATLEHHVGKRIGGKCLGITTHIPIRKYYKTRNRFQVWKEYGKDFPGYIRKDKFRFLLELFRLLLLEPEKKDKLNMMWRGFCDYKKGHFGPYQEH